LANSTRGSLNSERPSLKPYRDGGIFLRHCVQESMRNNNPNEANKKIEELTELLIRRTTI
ncbi:hypothetical protein K2X30_14205, partial [bacterium]|nr:hypothetical protein [bacterium]